MAEEIERTELDLVVDRSIPILGHFPVFRRVRQFRTLPEPDSLIAEVDIQDVSLTPNGHVQLSICGPGF